MAILEAEEDFQSSQTMLEELLIKLGARLLFLPKFHCEIREYPRFKEDFKNHVVPAISETQQSYVLKSCLTGTQLDVAKNVDHSVQFTSPNPGFSVEISTTGLS